MSKREPFANAYGGVLEIGRNDQGQVVGVDDAARLMEDLPGRRDRGLGTRYRAGVLSKAEAGEVACWGINECKGMTACTTAFNTCTGQNECKSRGYVYVVEKECCTRGGVLLKGSEGDPARR